MYLLGGSAIGELAIGEEDAGVAITGTWASFEADDGIVVSGTVPAPPEVFVEAEGLGGGSPPKDPPTDPDTLEFFRGYASNQGVNAGVPSHPAAHHNLTTERFPTSRPVTVPFPSKGKPQ